ncbi:MAG: hypothetical protein ACHQVS_03400 [Candidatus Babeliales bacterium]
MSRISSATRISLICAVLISGMSIAKDKPVTLDSEILKLIDGTPFLNGYEIKIMLHVLLKLQNMLDGEVDASGKKEGYYALNGQRYSINELIALEAGIDEEFSTNQARRITGEIDAEQFVHIEATHRVQKNECAAALQEAKDDFEKKISPYVGNARGAKQQLCMLIQESCKKHNRLDSILLKWGEEQEGHEGEAMRTKVTTLLEMKAFCNDLTNFLKDMIHSCPKAVAHYKELKAQYTAQHK